jgi:hypothetical protein
MLNLASTAALIQLVTGAGVNAIQVHASFVDLNNATNAVTPGTQDTSITTATTTTIVGSPGANTDRNVKFITITNTSGSSCPVTVQHVDGLGNVVSLWVSGFTLPSGWMLEYNTDGNGWVLYNSLGTIQAGGLTVLASINVSAGTTSNNLTAFTLSNSNNVSFGLNGSTITASAGLNLSAGTTSNLSSAFTFGNGGGVTFGLNAGTITAKGAVGTISVFSQDADFVTNWPVGQASLSLQKLSFDMNISATQLALIANFSGFSNSTEAVTVGHAVYTLSAGTASLASSASRVISWTTGSQTNVSSEYGGASGTRYRTLGVSYAMTPGDYIFGWSFSTANGASIDVFGRAAMNIVGTFDGVETATFINGVSASSVAAFPATIAATNTNYVRTGFSALRQPGAILFGTN